MESNIIIKICFVLFLTGNTAVSILVGDERKEGKSDPRTEELEWITHFAPARPHEEKIARQVSSPSSNSLCPSGITGQFPYPPDCKRFINCWKGRGMIQVCAPGTLFNPARGECDYPDKVKCVEGEAYGSAPQPWVTRFPVARPPIAANQRYSRRDKENYSAGTITVRPNPGRPPYFGPSHLTRPTPRPTTPTRANLQEKVECPPDSAGLFPHPTDCTRFLNCWGGRMFIQKCGPGTYFNPDMSVCDHAGAIGCAHNELDADVQGVQDVDVQESPEEEPGTKEDYKGSKPSEIESPPAEDLYNSATNLFDVRSGVEEDIPEPTEKSTIPKEEEENHDDEGKKGRDPSWGKILNFGNKDRKPGGGTLFYDAHGNPVNSNEFWTQNGKPNYNNPRIQQQHGNNQPQNSTPQPGSNQPQYNTPYTGQQSGQYQPSYSTPNTRQQPGYYGPQYSTPHPGQQSGHYQPNYSNTEQQSGYYGPEYNTPTTGQKTGYNQPNYSNTEQQSGYYGPQYNTPSTGQQTGYNQPNYSTPNTGQQPWYYQPNYSTPRTLQQPGYGQPQYNTSHPHQGSQDGKRENEHGAPGDSNVYYLRPHNHVMNQYPPHLQNSWAVKTPIYHNPQSYPQNEKPQTNRPPAFNPYYPSSPTHTRIPGHFVLVTDKPPVNTRVTYDQHQTQELPATFLVPPRQDSEVPAEPNAGSHLAPEEPSRDLLPPHENGLEDSQRNGTYSPNRGTTKYEYSGWKPIPHDRDQVYNSSSTTHKPNHNSGNSDNINWRVHHNKEAPSEKVPNSPNREWWSAPTQNVNEIDPKDQIIAATTYRPISERWPVYHGNKNPYHLSTRTFSAATPTPEPTSTTKAPETTTTSNRVYVVYPAKGSEPTETSTPIHNHRHQQSKYQPYESSQKLKSTNPKKATEEDMKKRIKSEMDFTDSQEELNVKDVELYTPTLEDLLPNAGKDIRLKPLSNHLDGYIEMKKPNGEWGLVCDKDYGWMINEANVVCKELGYGRGAQISWQGYPLDSSSESIPVAVSEVTCNGNEKSLKDCRIIYGENDCDITKNAVGLRCFDNVTTQCHPEEVEFKNSCYRIVKRDDIDDAGLTLEEAAEYCNKIGGRLSDVISEDENDFISQWLMQKHPEVRSVLTGGIGSAVMGRSIWMWFGSEVPMIYQNWWKGWAEEKKIKHGTIHEPSCVVLRKSYPCFVQNEEETDFELELGNVEPEFCSANYFYWDVEECKKLRELKLPHLCKKPLEEIGCVVGRGEDYSGTASVTSSGLPCLPWDHPEVKNKLAHQITLQEWSTKLSGHNFCRNMGRQELHPWCFVEGKENSEYCSIPQCWDSVPGYSKSAIITSSCDETQFECKPGECIKRNWFCDGKKDCSNGRDEAMCSIFLQEFIKMDNKRMKGHGKEEWPEVNENSCAKLCLENRKFKCKSFSYDKIRRTCYLSETNIGLSGQVVNASDWSYYELSVSSMNCSSKKFMACRNGKCVNVTNICDGKDHCGDGTDESDCDRIGYQIRLTGSNETHKGRVEVKILGRWGAVCDDKFNLQAGEVVCRELGFKHGVAEILHNVHVPGENPIFLMDDLECLGNETSIRECSFPGWGRHDCKPEETVGVACRVPATECPEDQWNCKKSKECIPIRFLCDSVNDCDDESDEDEEMCNEPIKLRLSGGPNSTAGRVEIRYLGTWGTICDDNFNDAAASVICRIMGYNGPSSAFKNAHFGPGSGPIWLDGIQCFGNETNVSECDHSGWGKHNCKHDEDVSISCSNVTGKQKSLSAKPIAKSSDADLQLTSAGNMKRVLLRECGDRNGSVESIALRMEPRARVVNSDVVQDGIPWQASVRVRSPGGKSSHWCGAIVISPYHILTAGHCLRDYSKPAYFIRVGDFDTEVEDPEEQELHIDHLYIHPEFNRKLHLNNDIALVKVKGEIRLGERVRPACLAPSTDIYLPGTNCSISGWGSISAQSSGYARTLRRAYVPILEPSLCKAPFVYGNSLSEGMFCAGKLDGGVDSCQGDSGGPIMCEYEGRQYLYGITSWGHGCGRANKPGVYTNVAYYSQWIQEKILISLA